MLNSRSSLRIKKVSAHLIGETETERVWHRAEYILRQLEFKYQTKNLTRKQMRHLNVVFPMIAIYKALLERHPASAVEIIELGEASHSKSQVKTYQMITRVPLGKPLLMKAFAYCCNTECGSEAGFSNRVRWSDSSAYQMEVFDCPYEKYCRLEGVPELAQVFCENDMYLFDKLDGIEFTRLQALGLGGDRCDFLLEAVHE